MPKKEKKCIYPHTIKFDQESLDIINSVVGLNFSDKLKNLILDYDRMKLCLDMRTRNAVKLMKISQDI